ncbi:hypothetical protein [Streptomyces sp. NPDC056821]|uniref:hypothetical protein n=1 Tax=unclassified Streptomyces TaxID=2593676 RepID=UPI00369A1B5A
MTDPTWLKSLGPYAAVLAAIVTGFFVSMQWLAAQRAQKNERKRELFAEAYEACIEYAEMPYAIRRRRADDAPGERIRLSEEIRKIQIKIARHEAWIRFESPKAEVAYSKLVLETRQLAGTSMKEAWLTPGASEDHEMVIPTSAVDLRPLAVYREKYMQAVESHLRPRRLRSWIAAIRRVRRSLNPRLSTAPIRPAPPPPPASGTPQPVSQGAQDTT